MLSHAYGKCSTAEGVVGGVDRYVVVVGKTARRPVSIESRESDSFKDRGSGRSREVRIWFGLVILTLV